MLAAGHFFATRVSQSVNLFEGCNYEGWKLQKLNNKDGGEKNACELKK